MSNVKAWIGAFRLRTLPLSFSVIIAGSAFAYNFRHAGSHSESFSWSIFGLTLLTTLLLQILSNLANDYGDAIKGADNEDRIGPERAIQSGAITPKSMLKGIIITSVLSFGTGIWLLIRAFNNQLDWTFLTFVVLGLLAIAAAIKYTVGKKAYGYSGLGDLFVFIFFGLVGVIGTIYLQTQIVLWPMILPAITMGCFSVAVLNLNNMRDRVNDQKVGKNTLAVKLGFKGSKIYHYIIFSVGYLAFPIILIAAAVISNVYQFLIPVLPVMLIHLIHLKKVIAIKDPKEFDPELKKIALSAFLFSLLYFVTVLFFI